MIPKGISQTSIPNLKSLVLNWKHESLYYCNLKIWKNVIHYADSWMAASSTALLYRISYFQTEHYNSVLEIFRWYQKWGLAKHFLGVHTVHGNIFSKTQTVFYLYKTKLPNKEVWCSANKLIHSSRWKSLEYPNRICAVQWRWQPTWFLWFVYSWFSN